jgi:hypothetical protein
MIEGDMVDENKLAQISIKVCLRELEAIAERLESGNISSLPKELLIKQLKGMGRYIKEFTSEIKESLSFYEK